MHCDNIQKTRGAVMFTDVYSKEADAVGLGHQGVLVTIYRRREGL